MITTSAIQSVLDNNWGATKFYDEIESNGLTGEKLRNYLDVKYNQKEISAYGIKKIWEKYGDKK